MNFSKFLSENYTNFKMTVSSTTNFVNHSSNHNSAAKPTAQQIRPQYSALVTTLSSCQDDTPFEEARSCKWMLQGDETRECGELFFTMRDLVTHIEKHVNDSGQDEHICRWLGCERAAKPFKAKYKLTNHIRVHTGEKPFRCSYCETRCRRKENKTIHERTHTKEKPYECKYPGCTKRFVSSSDRKKHSYVHKATKPMVCKFPECKKKFRHPNSFSRHMKKHEAERKDFQHKPNFSTLSDNTVEKSSFFSSEQTIFNDPTLEKEKTKIINFYLNVFGNE